MDGTEQLLQRHPARHGSPAWRQSYLNLRYPTLRAHLDLDLIVGTPVVSERAVLLPAPQITRLEHHAAVCV